MGRHLLTCRQLLPAGYRRYIGRPRWSALVDVSLAVAYWSPPYRPATLVDARWQIVRGWFFSAPPAPAAEDIGDVRWSRSGKLEKLELRNTFGLGRECALARCFQTQLEKIDMLAVIACDTQCLRAWGAKVDCTSVIRTTRVAACARALSVCVSHVAEPG